MLRLTRRIPGRVVIGLVAAMALGAGVTAAVLPSSTKALPPLTRAQLHYLALARQGVAQTSRWWDKKLGWYVAVLGDHHHRPLAKLWDTNGLFEALDEIAIARPTAQNLAAVTSFANASERYWNRHLKPVPGYAPYLGDSSPRQETWFDDNAWIGIAFLDAYRATGDHAYATDAERAFAFIAAGGWDARQGGGMWWDTSHQWLSGEALAAASDLAARLYQTTHRTDYLTDAEGYIGWANKNLLSPQGVYLPVASTPYPYLIEPDSYVDRGGRRAGPQLCRAGSRTCKPDSIEVTPCKAGSKSCKPGTLVIVRCPARADGCKPGSTIGRPQSANATGPRGKKARTGPKSVAMPHDGEGAMVAAMTALCEATGKQSWCTEADRRARDDIEWLAPFADGPQYDSVLIRGLLALYSKNHDARLYDFAVKLAGLITEHARTSPNVYLRGWDGRSVPSTSYGSLRTDAGSISVFADLAMVKPPSRAAFEAENGASSGRVPKGPA